MMNTIRNIIYIFVILFILDLIVGFLFIGSIMSDRALTDSEQFVANVFSFILLYILGFPLLAIISLFGIDIFNNSFSYLFLPSVLLNNILLSIIILYTKNRFFKRKI